jgi:type I restriction enzyme M protein
VSKTHRRLAAFIWSVADLLRGDDEPPKYGRQTRPSTVLRRLDYALEPARNAVLVRFDAARLTYQASENSPRLPGCSPLSVNTYAV